MQTLTVHTKINAPRFAGGDPMKTPQLAAMPGMTALGLRPRAVDEKTVAERQWQAGLKPRKPQLPPDEGLFGDSHLQLDLVEMLQEPTNE
jgi:hypothetical protein